jgi:polyisoprenoid-binding protein YceI
MFRSLVFAAFVLSALSLTAGEAYTVDQGHSFINWSVSHNNVGVAYGRFNEFSGTADFDGDNLTGVDISIQAESIDSAHGKRDEHLRKPDFFDAKQFPTVTFKSTGVKSLGDNKFEVSGDFTMLGVTKPASFTLTAAGPVPGRGGTTIRGLHGTGVIKRSEFGMNYAMGGIGDEVTIVVSMEVVK